MKQELSRTELKAAKGILKSLLAKGELYSGNDDAQAEVVIGLIDHIEKAGNQEGYQTSITNLENHSSLIRSELTAVLNGMSVNFAEYINVTTTLGLETVSFNYEGVAALAIHFIKKYIFAANHLDECRENSGRCYRVTWSRLVQKIEAEAEAELTAQLNLQAANSVEEITAEDDGSNDDAECAVTPEAFEVAVQAEIDNAVTEKVKKIELENCLWWINKTAELVAETRKEIEKENLTLARINARWAVNDILTEYVRTILGKGFVGTCFDNSRCCFFPQIKCRASYHKELADSALIFGVNEIYAWVKDYGDGGIHIHGIQEDGGEGWGSTIDLADYENVNQLEAALQIIKKRIAKPRNGYVVDMPEVAEVSATAKITLALKYYAVTPEAQEVAVQAEIDNAVAEANLAPQMDLQAANDYWDYEPVPVPEEEPTEEEPAEEKVFVAYVLRFDGWSYHRKGEEFFNNATDAFNYLAKKKYKNDNWELVIEVWDSEEDYNKYTDCHSLAEEHIIYKNNPDFGEETASAEIQKLIEERDAKAAADTVAEEKALAEEKARKEKLEQAKTTCKALYDDWAAQKKKLADLRRYRQQCKDANKKAAYDLKIAELEKAFKPLDDKHNAAWDILIHSKANDFEAEI